jgi:hypothetical protein
VKERVISAEDGAVIDSENICTNEFSRGDAGRAAKGIGGRGVFNGTNIGTTRSSIGLKVKTKNGVVTFDGSFLVDSDGIERVGRKVQRGAGEVGVFRIERQAITGTLEMKYIGGKMVGREIIHVFVETSVIGNLNLFRFNVIPKDIFGGVRKVAEEDSLLGMWAEATTAFARGRTQTRQPKVRSCWNWALVLWVSS